MIPPRIGDITKQQTIYNDDGRSHGWMGWGAGGGGRGECVVGRYLYVGLYVPCVAPDTSADIIVESLQYFAGDRRIRRLHSDRSGEIGNTLKLLEFMPHSSQPGMQQTTPSPN